MDLCGNAVHLKGATGTGTMDARCGPLSRWRILRPYQGVLWGHTCTPVGEARRARHPGSAAALGQEFPYSLVLSVEFPLRVSHYYLATNSFEQYSTLRMIIFLVYPNDHPSLFEVSCLVCAYDMKLCRPIQFSATAAGQPRKTRAAGKNSWNNGLCRQIQICAYWGRRCRRQLHIWYGWAAFCENWKR